MVSRLGIGLVVKTGDLGLVTENLDLGLVDLGLGLVWMASLMEAMQIFVSIKR